MQFYCMKDRVKQKDFLIYWKPLIQNMGDYLTKHHPPYQHIEIHATYLYMENTLLKIDQKFVHEWENSLLLSNHTVVLTPNHTVLQGYINVICTYGNTKPTTAMYTV